MRPLYELAREIGERLVVNVSANLFDIKFEGCEVERLKTSLLFSPFGTGLTVDKAADDYFRKIQGETLVFDANQLSQREYPAKLKTHWSTVEAIMPGMGIPFSVYGNPAKGSKIFPDAYQYDSLWGESMKDVINIDGVQYRRVGSEEKHEVVKVVQVVPHYTEDGHDFVAVGMVRIKKNMDSDLLNPEGRTMCPNTHLKPGDRIMIIKQ